MKQYTKQITVQAVQWTGENEEEVRAFFLACGVSSYDYHFYKSEIHFSEDFDSMTCPIGRYLVSYHTDGTDVLTCLKADDFLRDYKEVTE